MRIDCVGVELIVKVHSLLSSLNRRFSSPSSVAENKRIIHCRWWVAYCTAYPPPTCWTPCMNNILARICVWSLRWLACSSQTHTRAHRALARQAKGHETSWIENEASPLRPSLFICMKESLCQVFELAHLNSIPLLRCCLFHICHSRRDCFNMHGRGALIVTDPSVAV